MARPFHGWPLVGYRQTGEAQAGAWCATCLLPSAFVVPALMVEMRPMQMRAVRLEDGAMGPAVNAGWAETAVLATTRIRVCPDCGAWQVLLPGEEIPTTDG